MAAERESSTQLLAKKEQAAPAPSTSASTSIAPSTATSTAPSTSTSPPGAPSTSPKGAPSTSTSPPGAPSSQLSAEGANAGPSQCGPEISLDEDYLQSSFHEHEQLLQRQRDTLLDLSPSQWPLDVDPSLRQELAWEALRQQPPPSRELLGGLHFDDPRHVLWRAPEMPQLQPGSRLLVPYAEDDSSEVFLQICYALVVVSAITILCKLAIAFIIRA